MHEANTALLDILVDNSVIIPSFQNRASTFFEEWSLVVKSAVTALFTSTERWAKYI